MPTTCVVSGCLNRGKIEGITYHSFPKNPERREQWTNAVEKTKRKGWKPSKCSLICSAHFREVDIDRTSLSCVRIRDGAIPSIFPAATPNQNGDSVDNALVFTVKEEIIEDVQISEITQDDDSWSTLAYHETSVRFGEVEIKEETRVDQEDEVSLPSPGPDEEHLQPFSFVDCESISDDEACKVSNKSSVVEESPKQGEVTSEEIPAPDKGSASDKTSDSANSSIVRREGSDFSGLENSGQSEEEDVFTMKIDAFTSVNQKFDCPDCNRSYLTAKNLSRHKNNGCKNLKSSKATSKKLKCPDCDRHFQRQADLVRHSLIHSGRKPFNCTECDKGFMSKHGLDSHLRSHAGIKPYLCHHCGRGFVQQQHLTTHLFTHSEIKPFNCNECSRAFTTKAQMVEHSYTHSGLRPHSCKECDKSYSTASNLLTHRKTHSKTCKNVPRVKGFSCHLCNKSFYFKQALNQHLNSHFGIRPFSCNQCDQTFTVKANLNTHKLIHTGEKRFSCSLCDKSFTQLPGLNAHLRMHNGIKPYVCDQCGRAFTQKPHLRTHLMTHSGLKPFSCEQCGHAFSTRGNLKAHLLVHSGIRPHKCDQCDKAFVTNSQLRKHLRKH